MDWREELRKALTLQEVDRQLDALRAERQGLVRDAREVSMEKDLHARRARLAAKEAELASLERQQRLQELERQSQEAERERSTRRLYGGEVKTARDAEGLQKNIDGAAKKIDALETSILEAMERAKSLREELADDRDGLTAVENALRQRRHANRIRLGELDGQIPLVAARREDAARHVDAQVLREYERVRARCAGIAVASAAGGACGACGFGLSAMLQGKVRAGGAAVSCEHCGRLLVDA